MYRYLMEFIEQEGSYPKSRCILQCILYVPLVLFGTVALWTNTVGLVLFWVLSVPLFVLPIYRCVHETSYIQRYTVQLVHDAVTVLPGAVLLIAGMPLAPISAIVTVVIVVSESTMLFPRDWIEFRRCKTWLAINDLYYREDFQKILKQDRGRRYGISWPIITLGIFAASAAILAGSYWGQWDAFWNETAFLLAAFAWICGMPLSGNIGITWLKLRFLRGLRNMPTV